MSGDTRVDKDIIVKAIDNIANDKRIVIEELHSNKDKGDPEKAVYLAKYHLCETNIASRLKTLMYVPQSIRKFDIEKAISWVQDQLSITLAERQIEAVRCATQNKVMVITGGPGTGKTTIIKAVIRIFSSLKARIMLAAPTGRAAKRMSEATGHEAKTIHRLLEYDFQATGFQKNDEDPIDCDLMIVDEASMIDTILMHHFLKAIPRNARLVLVGDVNQLPAVGAGDVLRDIIDSKAVPVVELNEIFRQAKESSIIVNAHRINKGLMPNVESGDDKLSDFYFIEQEEPEKVLESIVSLVSERIPKRFGFDPVDDIQVITPMKRGIVGMDSLNTQLQNVMNPKGEELSKGGKCFRVNDKVMQVRNNYDKEVFNGDIDRIINIDREMQEVIVSIDDREVSYDYSELDEIVLAYAISVHKSQGSEYPVIVIPILIQHYVLLQRNLVYTGITRGKKLVIVIGTKKAMAIAIRNDKTASRYTALSARLKESRDTDM